MLAKNVAFGGLEFFPNYSLSYPRLLFSAFTQYQTVSLPKPKDAIHFVHLSGIVSIPPIGRYTAVSNLLSRGAYQN